MTKRGRIAALILLLMSIGLLIAGCAERTRPQIGQKPTMRVTFRLANTHRAPAGQDVTEHAWTFTAELEPLAIAPDGSVTTKAAVAVEPVR